MYKLMELAIGRPAEHGARQILYAALGPDGKDGEHVEYLKGAYVACSEVSEPGDFVIGREGWEAQERIWVSCLITGHWRWTNFLRCVARHGRYLG